MVPGDSKLCLATSDCLLAIYVPNLLSTIRNVVVVSLLPCVRVFLMTVLTVHATENYGKRLLARTKGSSVG